MIVFMKPAIKTQVRFRQVFKDSLPFKRFFPTIKSNFHVQIKQILETNVFKRQYTADNTLEGCQCTMKKFTPSLDTPLPPPPKKNIYEKLCSTVKAAYGKITGFLSFQNNL